MTWLATVLAIAIAIALLRGGRLSNLAEVHLRAWPLLFLGLAMQVATNYFPTEADWSKPVALALILTSLVLLLLLVWLNRHAKGMWLAGVGILMNFSVIALNGGMPVSFEAATLASATDEFVLQGYMHVLLDDSSLLPFLADVIPLRFLYLREVISMGDVFLAVGLARFLEDELRRPVPWFKHKVSGPAGSAAKT